MTPTLELALLRETLCVARLPADAPHPGWLPDAGWYSLTRTHEELSIVCASGLVPADVGCQHGFRALQVRGPLDFSLTGILLRVAAPLAAADISIFAVSTFDTDYILVPGGRLADAVERLQQDGIIVYAPD